MGNFVNLNYRKNSHMTVSEFILLLHSGRLVSATILLSLVTIVKLNIEVWTKLLTGGRKLAFSLRLDLHRW